MMMRVYVCVCRDHAVPDEQREWHRGSGGHVCAESSSHSSQYQLDPSLAPVSQTRPPRSVSRAGTALG